MPNGQKVWTLSARALDALQQFNISLKVRDLG